MSASIPERNNSQRSYLNGDDELSVRRINRYGKDVEGRPSNVGSWQSETTSSLSGDQSTLHSCALKHFSKHRSSHLRFLAWVAYTRRFSNDEITNEERRTCPLLWCRTEFENQDAMLQHVWNCPHLSKGLYYCFHCKKHERLGKFHKRCTGAPSKTDRFANVAKRIFSKLGSNRKGKGPTSPEGTFNVTSSWKSTDVKDPELFRESPHWGLPAQAQELSDTSIACAEMAADWTAACQELADTSVMDMVRNDLHAESVNDLDVFQQQDNYYAEQFDDFMSIMDAPKIRTPTPKLRLDTSMSPLYRGERNLQINPSQQHGGPVIDSYPAKTVTSTQSSYAQSLLDELVSPMSAVGTFNPLTSLEVSPTDTEASGASFFTDSGYTSATSRGEISQCPSRVPSTKRTWECAAIPEEHFYLDVNSALTLQATVPSFEYTLTDSLFSTPAVSRSSSKASSKSKEKATFPHWDDARSLIKDFSDILDEHMTHTKNILEDMPPSPIISELLAMSRSSLISIGLEALAGVLEGRIPLAIVQVFAFTHIAFACTIALNHDENLMETKEWFQDLLSWVPDLASERHKQIYARVASAIWQPKASISLLESVSAPIIDTNLLLHACHLFLDVLEHAHAKDQEAQTDKSMVGNSDFNQLSFILDASSRVTRKLLTIPTIEAFYDDIQRVQQKLLAGKIDSARELELELICAAKVSSQSSKVYARFLDNVALLCNELYDSVSNTSPSRASHRVKSINLIKQFLPDEVHDNEQVTENQELSFDDQCFDFEGASGDCQMFTNDSIFSKSEFEDVAPEEDILLDLHSHFATPSGTLSPHSFNVIYTPQASLTPAISVMPTTTHSVAEISQSESSHREVPIAIKNTDPILAKNPIMTARYKCHCGYIPAGEEKWKASNLRRHKRTQHPDLEGGKCKEYRCQWPGCKSVFTRSDNLRSHQRTRGHAVLVTVGISEDRDKNTRDTAASSSNNADDRKGKKQRINETASVES